MCNLSYKTNQIPLKKILTLFIVFITISNTHAQIIRSYANEFLNIGIGAKALGMSKSVSSFSTGVEAGYWNPAGVISVQDFEFSGMHNALFSGIGSYDYIGVALPIERDNLAAAVSIIRLGVDNILNTTTLIDSNGNINLNNITSFSSSDVAAIISLSKSFPKLNLNVGANAKIIRRNIGDFATGNGFGFDIGAQFKKGNFKIGLMIRDATTTFTAWNVNNAIFDDIASAQTTATNANQERPEDFELTLPSYQLGISYFFKFNDKYSLLSAFDLLGRFLKTNDIVATNFTSFSPSTGLELAYKQKAFFRIGAGNFQNTTDFNNNTNLTFEPTLGVGIRIKSVDIDYALTNVGASSGINYSNVFSIKVKLNQMR